MPNPPERIQTPTLGGVLLTKLQIDSALLVANAAQQFLFQLSQQVTVGVTTNATTQQTVPIVIVDFDLHGAPGVEQGSIPISARARFHALFESDSVLSRDEWLVYTSTPESRNVALQAVAVCQRYFRDQLALVGIPRELVIFGPLGQLTGIVPTSTIPQQMPGNRVATKKIKIKEIKII